MAKIVYLKSTEKHLVKGCKAGKAVAQRVLYERYAPLLMGLCRRYLRNTEDAEEVLSTAFIKIFERIHQYKGTGSLKAWMKKIAVNEALNYLRSQKNFFEEGGNEEVAWGVPANESEPLDENELLEMIAALPLGYRTVFNLYAIEGYAHKEIAEKLGISESTSKTQLKRARALLQKKLMEVELLSKES